MIGIVVVTHGDFGAELMDAANVILGADQKCAVISVDISRGMDVILDEIKVAAADQDQGDGVLILTDMFGGTPTNLSLSLLESGGVEVITGVNLPMLLKVLSTRESGLQKVASEAKSAGKQGILVAGEVLRRKIAEG